MEWIPVGVGTVFSLLFAVVITLFMGKGVHGERAKQPTYEELKRQRDALLFWFSFTGFWILVAAPRVNWSYFGEPWTGLFFSVCLMAVLVAVGFIYNRMRRAKSDKRESLQGQP